MRKLSLTEIAKVNYTNPDVRAELAAHYDALLVPFAAGDYGLAEPLPHETPLAVRRRLTAAAERRGWRLVFMRTEGEGLIFRVRTGAAER